MKARLLKRLLNNTGYIVNNERDYIAVGSPMCHDLISVNKKTLRLAYALDTFHKGRESLAREGQKELLFIWDKLQELIDNGEIVDIINGDDGIINLLPVYTYGEGVLIETFTDKYGYPNTDIAGNIMYENRYYKEKIKAIESGQSEYEAGVRLSKRRVEELEAQLKEANEMLKNEEKCVQKFKELKAEDFFMSVIVDMEKIELINYDFVIFLKDNKIIFHQDTENKIFWCDVSVWSKCYNYIGMENPNHVKTFMSAMLEKHLKLEGFMPELLPEVRIKWLEKRIKLLNKLNKLEHE